MKGFKRFLVYLGIFVAIIIAAVLMCIAVMYFSPGTSILGYQYILYNKYNEETISIASGSGYEDVQAFEIKTGVTDVYIYPNLISNEIEIKHNQGLSGFVKTYSAGLNLTKSYSVKTFEDVNGQVKTFTIEIEEPSGWVSDNDAYVSVYLPSLKNFDVLFVSTNGGTIDFFEEKEYNVEGVDEPVKTTLSFENYFLKTENYADIVMHENFGLNSSYYFTTDKGDVVFDVEKHEGYALDKNNQPVTMVYKYLTVDTMKFTTNSGGFTFTTIDGLGSFSANNFIVRSYGDNIGPYIKINNLNVENFDVRADFGSFYIDNINAIANSDEVPLVIMTLKNTTVNFGEVNGKVSILSEGNNVKNNIYINKLSNNDGINAFESGAGNIKINNLEGDASLDATSGNITVSSATVSSNIYAYTSSGSINIKYIFNRANNSTTKLTVITHTGNINLTNISCLLEVQVLSNSASSKLDLTFSAVVYQEGGNDNIINAKNRDVNILLKGRSDYLQFRILSLEDVVIKNTPGKEIERVDEDYLLTYSKYSDYTKMYRVGYSKNETTYNEHDFDEWGKLLISTAGLTNVNANLIDG